MPLGNMLQQQAIYGLPRSQYLVAFLYDSSCKAMSFPRKTIPWQDFSQTYNDINDMKSAIFKIFNKCIGRHAWSFLTEMASSVIGQATQQ